MASADRLTVRARKVIERSVKKASERGLSGAVAEDVLLSLIDSGKSLATDILERLIGNLRSFRRSLERLQKESPASVSSVSVREILELASQEAQNMGHTHVGTEHLLMGILHATRGAVPILRDNGVDLAATKSTLETLLSERGMTSKEISGAVDLILGQREDLEDRTERFTERGVRAMQEARRLAAESGWPLASTGHLLSVLLQDDRSMACQVLAGCGISRDELRARIVEKLPPGVREEGVQEVALSPNTMDAVEAASEEAMDLAHDHVGTGHLLLGLLMTPEGAAYDVLSESKLDIHEVRGALIELLAGRPRGWSQMIDSTGEALPGWQQRVTANREVRNILERAFNEAEIQRSPEVSTEHLLLGILGVPRSTAAATLRATGISLESIKADILGGLPENREEFGAEPHLSSSAEQALFFAAQEAAAMGHTSMGTEELLLGLLRSQEGAAARRLRMLGMTPMRLRADILRQWMAWETIKRDELLLDTEGSMWSSLWEAAMIVTGARRMAEHLGLTEPAPAEGQVGEAVPPEHFSPETVLAIDWAQKIAGAQRKSMVDGDSLLLGLLKARCVSVKRVFHTLLGGSESVRSRIPSAKVKPLAAVPDSALPYAAGAKSAIAIACIEKLARGHALMAPHHLLIGLVLAECTSAHGLFKEKGMTPDRIREAMLIH